METLIACALECGAEVPLLRRMLTCVTTDAALDVLAEQDLVGPAMRVLGRRIEDSLARRVPADVEIGYICFTNAEPHRGVLVESANARRLAEIWK